MIKERNFKIQQYDPYRPEGDLKEMSDEKILHDVTESQAGDDSIYYTEEELAKLRRKQNRTLLGKKRSEDAPAPTLESDLRKTLNGITRIIYLAINFFVGGILGAILAFIVLRGFLLLAASYMEVNELSTSSALVICGGIGLFTAFLAIFGEKARARRSNDYSVNAKDIREREQTSERGFWKVMGEEENKRNARMEQRRLEAEAEEAELLAQKENSEETEE